MTDEQLLMFIEAFNQAIFFYVVIGGFVALCLYDLLNWSSSKLAEMVFNVLIRSGKLKPRRDKELRSDDEAPSHSTNSN